EGFVDPYHPDKVYRLKNALYGLKQAPRAWGDILLVQIYVDDINFGSTNLNLSKRFEKLMHIKFEMSMMGELKFFLGIQIHQSPRGIFINQAKYAQEILVKHGMTSCDGIGTLVDQTKYRSKVGAIMYLTASRPDIMHATCYCARYQAQPTEKQLTAVKRIFRYLKDSIHMGLCKVGALMYLTASRPDIIHATCYCARYQAQPTEKHLTTVKQIFRYLKDTIHMALWCPKDTGFNLTAFSDSDHAGCLDLRKSTSEGIQFLEKVEKGIVELFFFGTEYQLADLFTKALPVERFQYLVRRLGMRCLTPAELEALKNEPA
nr:hypothetical protein [Tanacetum cinerariifolium]